MRIVTGKGAIPERLVTTENGRSPLLSELLPSPAEFWPPGFLCFGPSTMNLFKRVTAEFLGTFWLVLTGCGAAVLATSPQLFPGLSVGFVGVSLAFGLSVVTMAYAVGHISGGHFNPAVTLGLTVAGRSEAKDLLPYLSLIHI